MNDKTEPWKWGDENQPKPEEPPHIEGQRHLCCGYDAYMRPFERGNWIAYEDYARLKAEVERLKGIILAQSSEFVRNATKQEEEPLTDGWNSSVAKACDLLAEKDKDYARLKAEVEKWEFIHRLDSLAIKKQKEEIERLNEAIVRGAIIPDPKPE